MTEIVDMQGVPLDITPPNYKHIPTMLREIADEIERGDFGDVYTLAMGIWGASGLECFSGGRDSDIAHSLLVFECAAARLKKCVTG